MNQIVTKGMVLARTDFQEADRLITILTPDHGKVRLMAKGVRRSRSKLAGGIELFSVSNITYIPGKKEIGTLVSARLQAHCADIVRDINRTMLGYEILKRINRITEDGAGEEYFSVLESALAGLNNLDLSIELVDLWLTMQLLKITGHSPNLATDTVGNNLELDKTYIFNFESMAFTRSEDGPFVANHIRLLRLGIGVKKPEMMLQVRGADELAGEVLQLAKNMLQRLVRT